MDFESLRAYLTEYNMTFITAVYLALWVFAAGIFYHHAVKKNMNEVAAKEEAKK